MLRKLFTFSEFRHLAHDRPFYWMFRLYTQPVILIPGTLISVSIIAGIHFAGSYIASVSG